MRIDGKRAHVAVHDFCPGLARVLGAIAAVEGHGGENDLGVFFAADQMLESFSLEELPDGVHRRTLRPHDLQAAVMSDVVA